MAADCRLCTQFIDPALTTASELKKKTVQVKNEDEEIG